MEIRFLNVGSSRFVVSQFFVKEDELSDSLDRRILNTPLDVLNGPFSQQLQLDEGPCIRQYRGAVMLSRRKFTSSITGSTSSIPKADLRIHMSRILA